MSHAVYTARWREKVRSGAQSSAAVLVPLLVERYHPAAVVDVGAGDGWFCRQFEAAGVAATGVDGPWVDATVTVDFDRPPYPDLGTFDLAVCLEVAEHVDPAAAPEFVAWLTTLAPTVAFSAAVPGQGGEGHVAEAWPDFWADLFAACGYAGSGALRWEIWDDHRISWWYRQNLLVMGDHGLAEDGCPSVVHPECWAHHGRDR